MGSSTDNRGSEDKMRGQYKQAKKQSKQEDRWKKCRLKKEGRNVRGQFDR